MFSFDKDLMKIFVVISVVLLHVSAISYSKTLTILIDMNIIPIILYDQFVMIKPKLFNRARNKFFNK